MTDLVFEAILTPNRLTIFTGGWPVPLTPGMTVTVEIKTGRRSVLSYWTDNLLTRAEDAIHER